jgi:hypothetical protein
MGSEYLMRPPRSLREACKEVAASDPEFVADCELCVNRGLCAIYERIENGLSETVAAGCRKQLTIRLKAALAKKSEA